MHHASRRVTWRVHRKGVHVADLVGVAVLEERVELRAVALEFGAFIEDFAEGVLNNHDLFANADFATQLGLDIRRGAQVVCVHMGFDNPIEREAAILDFFDQLVCGIISDAASGIVDVHDAIDDSAVLCLRIGHNVSDRVRRLVKMWGDVGFN